MKDTLDIDSLSAAEHLLNQAPEQVDSFWVSSSKQKLSPRVLSLIDLAKSKNISISNFTPNKPDLSVFIRVHALNFTPFEQLLAMEEKPKSMILALDHLQDAHNFGALCRTAKAFGVDGIIFPKDRSVPMTAGVYAASVGTVATLPMCRVTNLNEALRKLKKEGYWIVGASQEEGSQDIKKLISLEKIVLVLGAEWKGLSSLTAQNCDFKVHIPISKEVESLNVSCAGAVLMYLLSQHLPEA